MSRRLLLRAVLLVGVVLAGALAEPDVRWPLWGWLRGEAMYRGKPTSYWRGPVKEFQRLTKSLTDGPGGVGLSIKPPPPSAVEVVRAWVSRFFAGSSVLPPDHDPAAVPVLVQLLSDDDPEVRDYAALALGDCGPAATAALPRLTEALRDDDPEVRRSAAVSLGRIDRRPEVTVPVLSRMLTAREALIRCRVANLLGETGPDAREAAPTLRQALLDEDAQVRVEAAEALKKIHPQAAAEAGVP
jgi:HEAT repeat protein